MAHDALGEGPVLRMFEVWAKPGCADILMEKFASTSAGVVQGHPGNLGFVFGRDIKVDANYVMFVSVWQDVEAVKKRFGDDWQESFLPPGYEALIERHALRHVAVGEGSSLAAMDGA